MKTTKLIQKGLMALLSIALMASLAMGQVFKNNGTLINTNTFNTGTFQNYRTAAGIVHNSGTIYATGNYVNSNATLNGRTYNQNQAGSTGGTINVDEGYTNSTGYTHNSLSGSLIRVGVGLTNTTAARFATDTGKVDYKGAATQAVLATIKDSTYGALTLSGGGNNVKTLGGNVVVAGLATIAASTEFAVGTDNTLVLNAATPFSNSGTFTANASGATVVYNNGSNQDVTGAAYYNLTLSTGGAKTVNNGASTVSIAAGGTLTNNSTFDLGANALTTTATSTITNGASSTIRTGGSVTFGAAHTIAGMFIYENATTTQSIGAATYGSLTLQGGLGATGQKNFPSGAISVTGTYSTADADRNYGTGTFAYAGTTAQNVLGGSVENYYNLTVSGSGGADTSVYKTVTVGNLYVQTDLTIEAGRTLNMASNAFNALPGGTNSNVGKIMWAAGNSHVIGGSGTTELYGSGNMAAGTYGNVWLTNGASVTIPAATSVISTGGSGTAGFFIIGSSTSLTLAAANSSLTVTSQDLDNEGTISNAGTITVN